MSDIELFLVCSEVVWCDEAQASIHDGIDICAEPKLPQDKGQDKDSALNATKSSYQGKRCQPTVELKAKGSQLIVKIAQCMSLHQVDQKSEKKHA